MKLPVVLRVGAGPRDRPQLEDDVDGVDGDLALDARCAGRCRRPRSRRKAAGADAPQEPALRQLVEQGDAVGQVKRVVVRQAADAGAELDVLGALERGAR